MDEWMGGTCLDDTWIHKQWTPVTRTCYMIIERQVYRECHVLMRKCHGLSMIVLRRYCALCGITIIDGMDDELLGDDECIGYTLIPEITHDTEEVLRQEIRA